MLSYYSSLLLLPHCLLAVLGLPAEAPPHRSSLRRDKRYASRLPYLPLGDQEGVREPEELAEALL